VNLDGVPDFVVGDPGRSELPQFWILSGKDGSVLHHITLADAGPSVYARIDGGVDVDGDGTPDILIATQPYGRTKSGALHLISGKTGQLFRTIRAHGMSNPRGDWAHFVSDFDHDGTPDVGALQPRTGERQASLSLFSGKTGDLLTELVVESGCVTKKGDDDCESAQNGFIEQESVGGFIEAGDVDHDGTMDFAVSIDGCRASPAFVTLCSGAKKTVIWKHQSFACCGSYAALAVVGDLDRDGERELAVSFHDIVDVVSGMSGVTRFEFSSDETIDIEKGFGWALAPLGDIDGDHVPDLAIAETEAGTWCGAIRAMSGKDGSRLWSSNGCATGEVYHLGYQLAALGDVDGDGISDLVAGSWEGSSGEEGIARVISGKNGKPIFELTRRRDDIVVTRKTSNRAEAR
jgi:hypothetical protein